METQRIAVDIERHVVESYPVIVGRANSAQLPQVVAECGLSGRPLAIITDTTVEKIAAIELQKALTRAGETAQIITFPAGEINKTRTTKAAIEDEMIARGFGRDCAVIAVGGGVVTDMAGFVAATFTRGVPYVSVPTTLVACADAAIGGKTAVDTPVATNLIGAFHQPKVVLIDVDYWLTLSPAQIRDGLGETVKHACLADAHFFDVLEDVFVTRGLSCEDFVREEGIAEYAAVRNCEIKRDVVITDVHESNRRMVLNLGHTIGRALEAAMGYTMSHGECVAVGLNLQAQWACQRGYLSQEEAGRIERLLQAIGLPIAIPNGVSVESIMKAMGHDKKATAKFLRFVFQDGIGCIRTFNQGEYALKVSSEQVEEFLLSLPGTMR